MNTTTEEKKTTAAIISASSGKSVEFREMPGIFSCLLQHKVAETKADFEYTGPQFTRDQWNEMLAFFKWTYDTEKSEAQVRLFVHPTRGWKIWAFPQSGGTGMTTKEVANEDATKQRAEIGEGYEAFGTIHHHCAAQAFQSGTDTHDETTVDGLHITIGKLDEKMHDLHARLYIKSHKFDVNMSAFWDIGDEVRASLKAVRELGFDVANIEDKAARRQMCVPAESNLKFNDQWKANYLLHKPQERSSRGYWVHGSKWCSNCMCYPEDKHDTETCPKKTNGGSNGSSRNSHRVWSPADVLEELLQEAVTIGYEQGDIEGFIAEISDVQMSQLYQKMIDLCSDNFVKLDQLHEAWEEMQKKAQAGAGKDVAAGTASDKMWGQMTPAEREEYEKSQAEIAEQYLMGMQ